MKLIVTVILCCSAVALGQITVNGNLDEGQYQLLAEKLNTNQGFGPNIDVSRILYHADNNNGVLYLGVVSKLNTSSSDGLGIWLDVTARSGATVGTPLSVSGGGHFISGNGGANPYRADFEVDYQFAFNPGSGSSSVFFDAGSNVGTPTAQFIGQTDQQGTAVSGPAANGIFTANSITWAYDNSAGALTGLELSIPFSELGVTAVDSLRLFAFIVSSTAFFSDVTVPGNIASGNPGFNTDFGGATLNTPPNSGPYHTDLNAGLLPIPPGSTAVPRQFTLGQNYPNPFNPLTIINYQLPIADWVTLKVYDLLGQEVKTLVNGRMAAGTHVVQWEGRNDAGEPVASGIYLYRLQAGDFVQTRKMVLMR